jgi:hypothetical protein
MRHFLKGTRTAFFLALAACATRPHSPVPAVRTDAAATTPAPTPAPSLLEEGSSVEAAVIVPPSSERAGVDWENEWIYAHYGRFRKKTVALASREGRRYDVLTVEVADHTERVIYFDITAFIGK